MQKIEIHVIIHRLLFVYFFFCFNINIQTQQKISQKWQLSDKFNNNVLLLPLITNCLPNCKYKRFVICIPQQKCRVIIKTIASGNGPIDSRNEQQSTVDSYNSVQNTLQLISHCLIELNFLICINTNVYECVNKANCKSQTLTLIMNHDYFRSHSYYKSKHSHRKKKKRNEHLINLMKSK